MPTPHSPWACASASVASTCISQGQAPESTAAWSWTACVGREFTSNRRRIDHQQTSQHSGSYKTTLGLRVWPAWAGWSASGMQEVWVAWSKDAPDQDANTSDMHAHSGYSPSCPDLPPT
jgi:hypothetical protein